MNICVFTDVHGNLQALKKLIETEDFKTADLRISLGDIVGLGPEQKECMDLIREYDCKFLLGNHEARMLRMVDDLTYEKDGDIFLQYESNRKELKNYLELFNNMPRDFVLKINDKKIRFMHYVWGKYNTNKPTKNNEVQELDDMFKNYSEDYLIFGHDHRACDEIGNRRYICVGSLGLKEDGNYLMIKTEDNKIEIEHKYVSNKKQDFLNFCRNKNYLGWQQLLNFDFFNPTISNKV